MRFEGKKWETLGRNTELQKCKTYRILAPITLSARQDQTEMFLLLFQPRYNPWICLLAAPESVFQGRLQESSGVFQCMMQKSFFFFFPSLYLLLFNRLKACWQNDFVLSTSRMLTCLWSERGFDTDWILLSLPAAYHSGSAVKDVISLVEYFPYDQTVARGCDFCVSAWHCGLLLRDLMDG